MSEFQLGCDIERPDPNGALPMVPDPSGASGAGGACDPDGAVTPVVLLKDLTPVVLVLATFCMRDMVALRVVAIASNVAFIAYGALADIGPVLLLHLVLLPVNALRLTESWRRSG